MKGNYDDMLHLPHHVSATHPQMPIRDRAAQFSPFAALSGYEAAVRETARLTTRRVELDEDAKAVLDRKLQLLAELLPEQPEVAVTCFQPDERKEGGAYLTVTGAVQKIDEFDRAIVMADKKRILIADILELEGELFSALD